MLVLSRYLGESIIVGEDVVVTVVDVRGNHVRLGIRAPVDVRVDREEVRARKDAGEPPQGGGDGARDEQKSPAPLRLRG